MSQSFTSQLSALRRGLAVLRLLAQEKQPCSFARLLTIEPGLTAASLSRLLRVLIDEELVVKDGSSGLYSPGKAIYRLAHETIGSVSEREILQPVVTALAASTRHSAAWFEIVGTGAVLSGKAEVEEGFHYIQVHQPMPQLLHHGFGQVIVAWSTPAAGEKFLSVHGPAPKPYERYRRRLEEIHAGRVTVEDLLAPPARTRIVAPVFRGDGCGLVGSLGITFPSLDLPVKESRELENAVRTAAARATRLLGEREGK